MIKTNFAKIKTQDVMTVADFGRLLKQNGFEFNRRFSSDEFRIFVSQDGQWICHIVRNIAKFYSTQDQKQVRHQIHLTRA